MAKLKATLLKPSLIQIRKNNYSILKVCLRCG